MARAAPRMAVIVAATTLVATGVGAYTGARMGTTVSRADSSTVTQARCSADVPKDACIAVTAFSAGRGDAGDPYPGDDYPTQWRPPVPQDSMFDDWGEDNRECTSFVAWALHSRNHFEMPFHDDAVNWGPDASARGFTVDNNPAVGAVAWEHPGDHVAWVYAVNGSTVTIEEYNEHYDGVYDWRVVPVNAFEYIHFADLNNPPPEQSPPTSAPQHLKAQGSSPQLQGNTATLQGSDVNPQRPSSTDVQGSKQHVQGPTGGAGAGHSTPKPVQQPTQPPPPPPPTYAETTGGETHTWTDYSNAGGNEGPTIPGQTTVQIACKVQGFKVADGNTTWYRIASTPWSNAYYASADAFYNDGATSGSLHGTPYYDPNVPDC